MPSETTPMQNVHIQGDRLSSDFTHAGDMTFLVAFVCTVGVFANTVAYMSLRRTPPSTAGRTLLRHQCFLDAALCVAGFVLYAQPQMWQSGLPALDVMLCRLWHSEFLFSSHANVVGWSILLIFIENVLIFIGSPCFNRMEICYHLWTVYLIGYVSAAPDLTTTALVNNKCVNQVTLPFGLSQASFYQLSNISRLVGRIVPVIYLFVFIRRADTVKLSFHHERHPIVEGRPNMRNDTTMTYYVLLMAVALTVTVITAFLMHYWNASILCQLLRRHNAMHQVLLGMSSVSTLFIVVLQPTYRRALLSIILCKPRTQSISSTRLHMQFM